MPKSTTARTAKATRARRKTATLYREPLRTDRTAGLLGIEPCEALLLTYADEDREPQDGERVYMHFARDGGGCGCTTAGTYTRETDGEFAFTITHPSLGYPTALNDTGATYYPDGRRYLMRVVGYVRDGGAFAWLDPEGADKWGGCVTATLRESELIMSEAEYVAEFGQTWEENVGIVYTRDRDGRRLGDHDAARAQLASLRARLRHVNESDEITTCSARFQLQGEIDRLERELAKPDPNDWTGFDLVDA